MKIKELKREIKETHESFNNLIQAFSNLTTRLHRIQEQLEATEATLDRKTSIGATLKVLPPMITFKQAAWALGVSQETIAEQCAAGKLRVTSVYGERRISKEDLLAYMEKSANIEEEFFSNMF